MPKAKKRDSGSGQGMWTWSRPKLEVECSSKTRVRGVILPIKRKNREGSLSIAGKIL